MEGYVQSVELAEVKYQAKNQGNITKDLQELVVEGKSIDKIKDVTVSIDDSGIVNGVLAQVDGYFCNYKKAESAICKLEKDFSGVLQLDFLDSLALNKNRVSSIELIYGINTNMDSLIDVSEEQQDKIMAYKVQDINTLYKIYIMADNYIKLPVDASGMFERYGNLDYIKFNNMIDTSDTVYMGGMFNHTDLLSETLDLTSFDTSKVEDMNYMFAYTNFKVKGIENFNLKSLVDSEMIFCASVCDDDVDSTKWPVSSYYCD